MIRETRSLACRLPRPDSGFFRTGTPDFSITMEIFWRVRRRIDSVRFLQEFLDGVAGVGDAVFGADQSPDLLRPASRGMILEEQSQRSHGGGCIEFPTWDCSRDAQAHGAV